MKKYTYEISHELVLSIGCKLLVGWNAWTYLKVVGNTYIHDLFINSLPFLNAYLWSSFIQYFFSSCKRVLGWALLLIRHISSLSFFFIFSLEGRSFYNFYLSSNSSLYLMANKPLTSICIFTSNTFSLETCSSHLASLSYLMSWTRGLCWT